MYTSLVEHLQRTGRLRTRPFDVAACPNATLEDLAADKLDLFLARAQSQRGYALGPGTPMPHALAHLNLLDAGTPSHADVLLFGKQPQRFLVTSEVKCMHFHGTVVRKPIPSYQIFKGTVFELVDQAVDFVMSKVAATVGTRAESNEAPLTYELPREAVSEAIVNAVSHRDYASNASVQFFALQPASILSIRTLCASPIGAWRYESAVPSAQDLHLRPVNSATRVQERHLHLKFQPHLWRESPL